MSLKTDVKNIALDMIYESGLINLSRRELCERAGIADGSFAHYMDCTFTEFVAKLKPFLVEGYPTPKVDKSRVNPELRREHILNIAVNLSFAHGYNNITRDMVAESAGVSTGLINRYFETMNQLRRDIMRAAVKRQHPEIIAQGLANKDKHALKAPPQLKEQAAQVIANL